MASKTSKSGSRKHVEEWFKNHPEWSAVQNHAKDATSLRTNGQFIFLAKGGDLFVYHISGQEVGKHALNSWINWEERNTDWFKSFVAEQGPYYASQFQSKQGNDQSLGEQISKIEGNQCKAAEIYEGAAKVAEQEKKEAADIDAIFNFLERRKTVDGIDPQQVLRDWHNNPELFRLEIGDKLGLAELNDRVFNTVFNILEQNTDPTDIVRRGQEARENSLSTLEELLEKQKESKHQMLEHLVGPEGVSGFQSLWDTLTPEQQASTDVDGLREIKRIHDTGEYEDFSKEAGKWWTDTFKGHRDTISPENMSFAPPTRDLAEELFTKQHPDWKPKAAREFNNYINSIANSGHGFGSTSYSVAEEEKSKAIEEERQREIDHIYDGLLKEHTAKGNTLGYIQKMNEAAAANFENPIRLEQQTLDPLAFQNNQMQYQQNQFNKDLAEGQMQHDTRKMQEGLQLREILKQEQAAKQQQLAQVHENVLKFVDMLSQINLGKIKEDEAFNALKHQIWKDRQQITALFEELGLKKESLALQQAAAEDDSGKWFNILATAGGIIGQLWNSHMDRKSREREGEANRDFQRQVFGQNTGQSSPFMGSSSGSNITPWITPTSGSPGIQGGATIRF